jgi:hypothetical protein
MNELTGARYRNGLALVHMKFSGTRTLLSSRKDSKRSHFRFPKTFTNVVCKVKGTKPLFNCPNPAIFRNSPVYSLCGIIEFVGIGLNVITNPVTYQTFLSLTNSIFKHIHIFNIYMNSLNIKIFIDNYFKFQY